jgi:hypothetical protein
MRLEEGKTLIGNVGLYFVAYRLSLLGWNVMPTTHDFRGIDLIAHDVKGDRKLSIQTKSLSKRDLVPLGNSLDEVTGDWWIIVTKITTNEPQCFILKPNEVRDLAHRGEIDGRTSFLLHPRQYDITEFREAWTRIGRGGVS